MDGHMTRTIRNLGVLMLTCGTLCLAAPPCHGASYAPRVGRPHPDFTLPNIADGQPASLSQFRGRKVLLIHLASW
jgi:hypothetical protein